MTNLLFANEYPIFGIDIGNGLWKLAGFEDHWALYDDVNIIQDINERVYNNQLARTQGTARAQGYLKIRVKNQDHFYAIGRAAIEGGHVGDWRKQRVMQHAKYRRGYLGLAIAYMLARVYSDAQIPMPKQVNVVTAHPPLAASVEFKKQVTRAVRGRWSFYLGDQHFDFVIEAVKVIDEITGGVRNLVLDEHGEIDYDNPLRDRRALIIDLGDGTLDVALVDEKGAPYYYDSAEIGLFSYLQDFADSFDEIYREHFGSGAQSGITIDRIYQIILDPLKQLDSSSWGGPTLDCWELFEQTMMPFFAQLSTTVNRMMPNHNMVLDAPQVAVTGGAGALLFDELCSTVFAPYSDEDRNDVHLCGPLHSRNSGMYFNAMGLCKDGKAQRVLDIMRRGA